MILIELMLGYTKCIRNTFGYAYPFHLFMSQQ